MPTKVKGLVLAGGQGTRLQPLTVLPDPHNPKVIKKAIGNKHLLPIYDRQMILYPIEKLYRAGITDIMIVTGGEKPGDFLELLGSGRDLWVDGEKLSVELTFRYQDRSGGIAEALSLCRDFVDGHRCVCILGDNIFEADLNPYVEEFKKQDGAKVLLKEVPDPHHFGVADVRSGKVVKIVEKPKGTPPSNLAVIGCYMYDSSVWDILPDLKPSGRGELEITDVNNEYIARDKLTYNIIDGFWLDSGSSFDHLLNASLWMANKKRGPVHS